MNYWLMKSEPSCFSIDDLKAKKTTMWDGVRNYQVRNMMRDQIKVGDRALFYHSSAGHETGIAGEMKIIKSAYPDPTQFDPKSEHFDPKSKLVNPTWLAVDVKFIKKFAQPVYLKKLKSDPTFMGMTVIQKGSRLSITSLTKEHFDLIKKLAN